MRRLRAVRGTCPGVMGTAGNGTRSSPATSSGRSTTRSGTRFARLQQRPAGRISHRRARAPARRAGGEDDALWLERAREAAARGPFGQHTHWTRPTTPGPPAATRARACCDEGAWLRERGAAADALLRRRLVHRRARRSGVRGARLRRLHAALRRGRRTSPTAPLGRSSAAPAWIKFRQVRPCSPSRPPARSASWRAGAIARQGSGEPVVHVYFHDTDLLDRKPAGGRSARRSDCSRAAGSRPTSMRSAPRSPHAPERPWASVARGGAGAPRRIRACRPRPRLRRHPRAPGHPRAPRRGRPLPPASTSSRAGLCWPCSPDALDRARSSRSTSPGWRSASTSRSCCASSSTARTTSTGPCSGARARGVAAVPRAGHGARLPAGGPLRAAGAPAGRRAASSPRSSLVALIVLAFGLGTDYDFTTTGLIPTAVVTCALAIGLLRAAYDSVALELMKVGGHPPARRARRRGRASRGCTGSSRLARGGHRLRVPRRRLAGAARPDLPLLGASVDDLAAVLERPGPTSCPRRGRLRRAHRPRRRRARAPRGRQGAARAEHDRAARPRGRVRARARACRCSSCARRPDRRGLGAEARLRRRRQRVDRRGRLCRSGCSSRSRSSSTRAGPSSTSTARVGRRRAGVRDAQVPHDGRRRRRAAGGRSRRRTRRRGRCSRSATTRA